MGPAGAAGGPPTVGPRPRPSESARDRDIRCQQIGNTLARLGGDVERLVRDAYAEGYRDGLQRGREQAWEPGAAVDAVHRESRRD